MLYQNTLDLDFTYKRKLFYYLQYNKAIVSLCAIVGLYTFKLLNNDFSSFLPHMLWGLILSTTVICVLSLLDKKLKVVNYLSSTLDICILYWGIYQSHFPFNTFIYWAVPFIIMSYYFTNIYFALFLFGTFVLFNVLGPDSISMGKQQWILSSTDYQNTFVFSSIVFAFFMFIIFHLKLVTRKQYINNLNTLLADFKSVNSFPIFNPNPIFEYSDKSGYVAKNDSAKEILSKIRPQDHAEIVLSAQQTSQSRQPVKTKLKLGDKTYQLTNIYADGQVNVYVADISEVETNTLKAQEKEQYAKAIIDAIPGFVSWVDSDLNYLGVNKNMARFFHLRPEEFVGRPLGTVTENEDQQNEIRDFVKELFESDKNMLQKELEYHYENRTYYSLITINKYNNNQNAVLVSIDYTSLKNAESKIREEQAKAQASAKLASFGEMAAGIAHEINNPLAIISGNLSIIESKMQKATIDLDIEKYYHRIVKSVDRINKIIRGMKNLARDGQGDPFEFTLVQDIIDDSLTLLSKKCSRENIALTISNLDHELGLECQTVQLSQVLVILINNAIDALAGQQNKWIKIQTQDLVDRVVISVTDSGNGIPEEQQDKIFQPFYTTKEVGKGTGLGLGIAAKIVKQHNAELFVDNSSQNTKFDLIFPKYQQQFQQSS